LLTRADDNEESVRRRLEIYEREFAPILAHYSPRPEFLRLDGQVGAARLADQISDFVQGPYPRTYLQQRIATHPHPDHPAIAMYNLIEMYKDVGFIRYVISQFAASVHELRPDYIAAPEARALPIFGALIHETGRPGIFIRKAGKLPATAPKLSESYTTAYSEEKIEMNVDPNLQGKTVMIVDDGISSGGTTLATVRLLEQAGMKVIAVRAVIQYHYRELEPDFVSSGILEMTETLQDLK
jgi:adenine phosphoribosyltransferase